MAIKRDVLPEAVKEKERAFQKFIQTEGLKTTRQRNTIVNVFFRLDGPPPECIPPILGVLSSTAHWIFRRGDVVSVTVSAADALGIDGQAGEKLIPKIWEETRQALGLAAGTAYLCARINKERRATFDQSPAGVAKRLQPRTALCNLILAGDATDTGLPATIEGAIRSGERAAALMARIGPDQGRRGMTG